RVRDEERALAAGGRRILEHAGDLVRGPLRHAEEDGEARRPVLLRDAAEDRLREKREPLAVDERAPAAVDRLPREHDVELDAIGLLRERDVRVPVDADARVDEEVLEIRLELVAHGGAGVAGAELL